MTPLSWQPPPVTKQRMTQEEALHHFEYRDGVLIYKNRVLRSNKISIGDKVGWERPEGYLKFNFKGKSHYAHRVIYLMHHGVYPYEVDHIDGDKRNNRIENLRAACRSENASNVKMWSSNKSGYKGVFWNTQAGKWQAKITVNRIAKHLGFYADLLNAAKAYENASIKYQGKFSPMWQQQNKDKK